MSAGRRVVTYVDRQVACILSHGWNETSGQAYKILPQILAFICQSIWFIDCCLDIKRLSTNIIKHASGITFQPYWCRVSMNISVDKSTTCSTDGKMISRYRNMFWIHCVNTGHRKKFSWEEKMKHLWINKICSLSGVSREYNKASLCTL